MSCFRKMNAIDKIEWRVHPETRIASIRKYIPILPQIEAYHIHILRILMKRHDHGRVIDKSRKHQVVLDEIEKFGLNMFMYGSLDVAGRSNGSIMRQYQGVWKMCVHILKRFFVAGSVRWIFDAIKSNDQWIVRVQPPQVLVNTCQCMVQHEYGWMRRDKAGCNHNGGV